MVSVLGLSVLLGLWLMFQAACEDASSTTAGVVAEVQAAANLDFNFINDDLEEIRTNFFRSLEDDNNRSAANLSVVLDQLYLHDLPSNTTGYNLSCLQEIREDLQDTLQDMIVGIESCGNLSNAMEQIDSSIVRYEELKSNVTQISKNLTSLLATCSSQYPAQSWDLVTCVFQQVATTHSLLAPYWAEFQELNRAAGAELLLLHFDTFRCYQASLTLLGSVNQTVLQEVATCKT